MIRHLSLVAALGFATALISACTAPHEGLTEEVRQASADPDAVIADDLLAQAAGAPVEVDALDLDEPSTGQALARPACASVSHTSATFTQKTTVCNNSCSSPVSFVVNRVGPDSPCLHASLGQCRTYTWANGLNYQGTTFGCD
jgi:hypothetical protein